MFRLSSLTLQARIVAAVVIPALLVGTALTVVSVNALQAQGEREVANLRERLMADKRAELKNVVQAAVSAIQPIYADAGPNDQEAKKRAAKLLRSVTFGESGYVFVYDYDGTAIAMHYKPELEGENLWDLQTAGGDYLLRELVSRAKEGGGFFSYPWDNPSNGEEEPKLSYATGLDKWQWMLGAGVYTTAIDAAIAEQRREIQANVRATVLRVAGVTLVAMLVLGALALWLSRSITRPLRKTTAAMGEIAHGDGDLTQRLDESGNDELSELAGEFNAFVAKMQRAVSEVSESTHQLSSSAEELSTVASQTRAGVETQGSETDQIATAINEMTMTVQEISRNGNEVKTAASNADEQARSGGQLVGQTVSSIQLLAEDIERTEDAVAALARRTKDIETVLDVISQVTEQTNLLALNAAIEAARAGEQGRGFAVVADEVRSLAQRSAESAKEIRGMIDGLVTDTHAAVEKMSRSRERSDETVALASQAGDALGQIEHAVSAIHDQISQIATAAEEQSQVAEEINRNVVSIVNISGQSMESMQQTETASNELARLGEGLRGLVQQFKT